MCDTKHIIVYLYYLYIYELLIYISLLAKIFIIQIERFLGSKGKLVLNILRNMNVLVFFHLVLYI